MHRVFGLLHPFAFKLGLSLRVEHGRYAETEDCAGMEEQAVHCGSCRVETRGSKVRLDGFIVMCKDCEALDKPLEH